MLRLVPVFLTTFFLSLNFGALLYVNSSYLSQFFRTETVSLLFLIGALGNIILFFSAPKLLKFFGKERLLFLLLLILLTSNLAMAFSADGLSLALSFVAYSTFLFMVYYCLDIFLEEHSINRFTGGIRGLYLTFVNAGIMVGPLIATFIVVENFRPIYLAAAFLLTVPLLISAIFSRKHSPLPEIHHRAHLLPFRLWWRRRNVRAITLSKVVLEIFYALMVIYTPLYLHNAIGFSWSELGLIFTVALLPFVLFEWPAGVAADRLWGEKEMLSLGFFITGGMLLIMPFLGKVFLLWMLVLFLSRVGACLVEIMTESYFFKKIDASETGLLSIFRLARPVGLILGAMIGAVSLNLFSFEKIFFAIAVIIIFGLYESLYLRDTL